MKAGLCNIGNSWVTIHKKMFYGHIAYKNIEDFSCKCGTNVRRVILSGVMTLEIKLFGKIEVYAGLYNCFKVFLIFVQFYTLKNIVENLPNGLCSCHFWSTLMCFHIDSFVSSLPLVHHCCVPFHMFLSIS
jgi:hypothetical protein